MWNPVRFDCGQQFSLGGRLSERDSDQWECFLLIKEVLYILLKTLVEMFRFHCQKSKSKCLYYFLIVSHEINLTWIKRAVLQYDLSQVSAFKTQTHIFWTAECSYTGNKRSGNVSSWKQANNNEKKISLLPSLRTRLNAGLWKHLSLPHVSQVLER